MRGLLKQFPTKLLMILSLITALHQPVSAQDLTGKTLLDIEILVPPMGSRPIDAQLWRQVFEKIDEPVRIRTGLTTDKPEVSERMQGPLRLVKVVGQLNRDGTLSFPDKTFQRSDSEPLQEWIESLKVYGAQGSPDGKRLWGLTREQFGSLHDQLSRPVTHQLQGMTLEEGIDQLGLAPLGWKLHSSAEALFEEHRKQVIEEEVQSLAQGASFAFLLSQAGLAFQPLRLPDGGTQLQVLPRESVKSPWPVGWPLDESQQRSELFGPLFKMVETGDGSFTPEELINSTEEQTGVRILLDRQALQSRDPEGKRLSMPVPVRGKKNSSALMVRSAASTLRLEMHYRLDESGKGFLLIAPLDLQKTP